MRELFACFTVNLECQLLSLYFGVPVYLYFCQLMKNVHVMYIVYYVNSQYFLASSACKKASAADMDNHISSLIITMCKCMHSDVSG